MHRKFVGDYSMVELKFHSVHCGPVSLLLIVQHVVVIEPQIQTSYSFEGDAHPLLPSQSQCILNHRCMEWRK